VSLDEIAAEVQGKRIEKEEPIPGPKEYVKINGVWQHTNMAWWVDKDKMNAPVPGRPGAIQEFKPGQFIKYTTTIMVVENYQCVSHVHHWKTELEEYCRVDEEWKCVRCHDVVPSAIQSMIKLYRPLKDV
jgi:hypothetical protein